VICNYCNHSKQQHDYSKNAHGKVSHYCWECVKDLTSERPVHKFVDNLTYIEELAKERKLV
jgi:hypothetical protein